MGEDVKGDHPQAVKDIDQDMKDLIVELVADTVPKVRKGPLTGDIPRNAGISPVGPSAFPVEAYECSVRGRRELMRHEKGSFDRAYELFSQALKSQADYGLALSGLAQICGMRFTFTGDAAGQWSNWVKNGRASYISGYHPIFLLARAVKRLTRKPYLTASLGLMAGYFGAMFTRVPKIDDPPLIRYIRKQQLRCVFGMSSIWK